MIGKTILHYKILDKLGEGGMGVVYKAEDTKLERIVAIKFLPHHIAANAEERARFKIEAKAAAALNHPNIATIYAIEEVEGEMFIVMEFIDGQELRKKVASDQLPVNNVIDLAMQIAEGLKAAHAKGVTHRDIKPANIMITGSGQVKIMDFGLAKIAGGAQLTKDHSTLGTAAYMSPEQARGEPVDHRTDIWSFGVVLYEMLTGQLPFRGVYEQAMIYSILNEEPEFTDRIPANFRAILQKALAKKPDQRYQNIAEALAELNAFSTGTKSAVSKPVRTSGHSPLQRKRWFLYGGIAALLLLAGFAYFVSRSQPIESIAVMPFVNASGNDEVEYLSDGMTETLISSLSQLPKLSVKSRSSVFRYKGTVTNPQTIGKELNVQALLNGRVVQRGEQLTLSLELIDAQTENVIWGEQYNRKQTDIVTLQSEIAREVSSKLKTKLSGADEQKLAKTYTTNPEAYQLYLKGNYYAAKFTKDGFNKGINYFQQAIAKDPSYAMAYYGLSYCYLAGSDWVYSPRYAIPKAKTAVEKALELDDSLSEAHYVLGWIRSQYDWNWSAAEHELRRAIEINPSNALAHDFFGWHLAVMGRFDESIVACKRALELDPLSPQINADFGWSLYFARRYDEALEHLRKAVDLEPNYWLGHVILGRTYEQKGMLTEAVAEFEKARQIEDAIPEILAALGHGYAISGRKAEALEIIRLLNERSKKDFVPSYNIATVYLGLGMKDDAIQYIGKSYEEGSYYMAHLKVEPLLDSLREDARFQKILKQMNLPQ